MTIQMAGINLKKYFSQWDGDRGSATGACGETCLKMVDCYLTGREISIKDIIKNGDNNPEITSIAGMAKAADWLGFGVDYYYNATQNQITKWLQEGKPVIAVIEYSKFPDIYKQDKKYRYGHFILITAITEDKKGIRFADPNFWGEIRNDGWMDNNKWCSWDDLKQAFYHNNSNICRNGSVLVPKTGKLPPVTDKCNEENIALNKRIGELENAIIAYRNEREVLQKTVDDRSSTIAKQSRENGELREMNMEQSIRITKLEVAKQTLTDRNNYLEPKLSELDKHIETLEHEIIQLNLKEQQYEALITEKNGEILVLKKRIETLLEMNQDKLSVKDALILLLNKIIEIIKDKIARK